MGSFLHISKHIFAPCSFLLLLPCYDKMYYIFFPLLMEIVCIFSVLYVTSKTRFFLQLQVCLSLTDMSELLTSMRTQEAGCALSFINPRLYFSAVQPMSPLLKPSAVIPDLYFSTLCHCVSHKSPIRHRKTAYCFHLHIDIHLYTVVSHEDKQKQSKSSTDTWSTKEKYVYS